MTRRVGAYVQTLLEEAMADRATRADAKSSALNGKKR
jgi:hypothetical protein